MEYSNDRAAIELPEAKLEEMVDGENYLVAYCRCMWLTQAGPLPFPNEMKDRINKIYKLPEPSKVGDQNGKRKI